MDGNANPDAKFTMSHKTTPNVRHVEESTNSGLPHTFSNDSDIFSRTDALQYQFHFTKLEIVNPLSSKLVFVLNKYFTIVEFILFIIYNQFQ